MKIITLSSSKHKLKIELVMYQISDLARIPRILNFELKPVHLSITIKGELK